MDTYDDNDRVPDASSWSHKKPAWRRDPDGDDDSRLPEWWELEGERFEGEWLIKDGCAADDEDVYALCMGRLLALRITVESIRRRVRGEDVLDDVEMVFEYLDALELRPDDLRAIKRLLAALQPFEPERIGDELTGIAWSALRAGLNDSARSCATVAYECAQLFNLHDVAAAAARAFAVLAPMEECPRAARRWHLRAGVHTRRSIRARAASQPKCV